MLATLNEGEAQTVNAAVRIMESRLRSHNIDSEELATFAKVLARLTIGGEPKEHFMAFWLNAQHQLISYEVLQTGTVTQCAVYLREVLKAALAANAVSAMFAHNHPSGNATPSIADFELTNALRAALKFIDVTVIDCYVVSAHESKSIVRAEAFYAELEARHRNDRAKKVELISRANRTTKAMKPTLTRKPRKTSATRS